MVKKVKCNVCNYKFFVEKSKVKEVMENKGLAGIASGSKIYNAIDCPKCGCQKVLWPRFSEINNEEGDDEECLETKNEEERD